MKDKEFPCPTGSRPNLRDNGEPTKQILKEKHQPIDAEDENSLNPKSYDDEVIDISEYEEGNVEKKPMKEIPDNSVLKKSKKPRRSEVEKLKIESKEWS